MQTVQISLLLGDQLEFITRCQTIQIWEAEGVKEQTLATTSLQKSLLVQRAAGSSIWKSHGEDIWDNAQGSLGNELLINTAVLFLEALSWELGSARLAVMLSCSLPSQAEKTRVLVAHRHRRVWISQLLFCESKETQAATQSPEGFSSAGLTSLVLPSLQGEEDVSSW